MSERFSFGKLDVRLTTTSDRSEDTPGPEVPFKIALLGDFSGQAGRETPRLRPAKLRPVVIDRDNLDEVLQKLGVEAHLQLGTSSQRLIVRFQSLDDFHPDQILANVSLFSKLRETRKKLSNPLTFAETAAEVRRWAGERQETAQAASAGEKKSAEAEEEGPMSAGFLLEGLNERDTRTAHTTGDWNQMLRDLVKPFQVAGEDPAQAKLVECVDAAICELMEAILHHPEFQALEATWRGVDFLVRRLETGSNLKLYLFDLTKDELASDLQSSDDLSRTALYRALVEETAQTPGADPWALLAGNYVFELESGDIGHLGRLAKIACAAGAPLVAAAGSSLVGCQSLATTPDPDDWSFPLESAVCQTWATLRALPEASSLGLIMPRFLLRLPYGKQYDPIESFAFEEMAVPPQHEHYLWGNPCFVTAYLLGRTFGESGWDFSGGIDPDVEGLPLHVYNDDGESVIKPCAETLLTERAARAILDQGVMALISMKGEDRVRLSGLRSVSFDTTTLKGRWS